MTLLQDIQYLADTKKDSKKTVADFILKHKNELAHLTLDDIQNKAYVSKSSLVRFAKALGFSGWKEFLIPLMEEIHKESQAFSHIDPDIPFKISDSNLTIAAKIAQVQTASVEDSLALLNEEALVSAAYSLKKADRVVVFGISPNNILAKIFRRRLSAIGKQIDVPLQDEMGLTALSLTDRDLAIFISYSGHLTQFPSKIMTYLTENQVTRLAITSQKHSPLAEACDLFLALSAREQVVGKISSFASEESILFVLNVLYAVYFALDYKDNMAYKQRMAELLEKGRLQ